MSYTLSLPWPARELSPNASLNIELFGHAERTDGTSGTHTPGESGVARSSNQEATRFSGW